MSLLADSAPPVLDSRQLAQIEAVHRGFLYQHLYAMACLFMAARSGVSELVVESDEDVEIVLPETRAYVQVKTRGGPLIYSDVESAMKRFDALRAKHKEGRRKGSPSFVVASNTAPGPALARQFSESDWPADVTIHWPGCPSSIKPPLPLPWRNVADALVACRDAAASLPFALLSPETLVWKLAGRIMSAAAGTPPHADHTFKTETLPELFEQLIIQLQDFPAPPPCYRSQDQEPPLISEERVRLITGFSGAGKTSWVSQCALQTSDAVAYFDVREMPGAALATTISRDLAARLFGKPGGKLGEILLPGASGPEILFALGKQLAEANMVATVVIDNAHRVPAVDLKSLIEHSHNLRFVLLAQPGPAVALMEATLQLHAEPLRGWSNETMAAEGAALGCHGDYAAYERLLALTAGMPLHVQSALQIAAQHYEGSVSRLSQELEGQTHVAETAQELILARVFGDHTDTERDAIGVLSLSDVPFAQADAAQVLKATFELDEHTVARLLRKLRSAGAIQVFGTDRFKIHDAIRLLGRAHVETLGSGTVRKAQTAIRDLLMASLPREWSFQKVNLLLRLFVALGNVKPLLEMATDEIFHEMGFMPEIVGFLKQVAASETFSAEDRFWALDGLVFADYKLCDDEAIRERLALMERLVTGNDLGQSARLAIGMKRMLFAAREGNAAAAQSAMEETVRLLPDRPEFVRIARYNYAHAMYELGMFEECARETLKVAEEYYEVLGLSLKDVVGKNPDEIESLLKQGKNHIDHLKHLADALDLYAKARNRTGEHGGLARIHAMKFYSMAQALDSFVRVGQDLVDDFVAHYDYIGARDVLEKNLIPTVIKTKLAGHIVHVRSQYAVVLAYCGAFEQADAEMARLTPYESGLDVAKRAELQRQRALIDQLKRHPPPPQWQFQLPPGKFRVNAPCPCGSGKKFKKCHGRRG